MKFKKNRELQMWKAETERNIYTIEKDIEDNMYILYVNNNKYSVNKTLKTAKEDALKYETK